MEQQSFSELFQRYTALLIRWLWLLVLAVVLAGGAAYLVSKRTTPVYQASTTVLINEAPATRSTDYAAIVASERQAKTYAQLISKQPVLEGVISKLALEMDVDDLKRKIQAQPLRETTLIEVLVEDSDPKLAADIANELVDEFALQIYTMQSARYAASKESLTDQLAQMDEQIQSSSEALAELDEGDENQSEVNRLEDNIAQYRQTYAYLLQSYEQVRLAEAQSTSSIMQVEPAVPPDSPIRPRTMSNTLIAAGVGLFLALGLVFLKEALDDTLRHPDEVTNQLDLPVLGMIARHDVNGSDNPPTIDEPRSLVSEAFRSLRTNIQFASVDSRVRTLLVTSPSPSDGKTSVAVNLAIVLAQSGRKVVLMDADLRRPRVHTVLGIHNRTGVSDLFVQDQIILDGSLQEMDLENLYVISSGGTPPNPAELLGSDKMADILEALGEMADIIVIDSSPVMAVTDASVLAPRVDGVLLVLKPGETNMAAANQTVEQLKRVGAKILGVVLNAVDLQRSRYSYYYYRGYYQASKKYSTGKSEQKDSAEKTK
jgi:non-specific protein-tyrosine kinase